MNHTRAEKILQRLLRERKRLLQISSKPSAVKLYRHEIAALEYAIDVLRMDGGGAG